MKHDVSAEVIFPEGTKFLQFVADNTDHDMAALNGRGTHHVLGSITIVNCGYVSATCPAHRVPRMGKGIGVKSNRVRECLFIPSQF